MAAAGSLSCTKAYRSATRAYLHPNEICFINEHRGFNTDLIPGWFSYRSLMSLSSMPHRRCRVIFVATSTLSPSTTNLTYTPTGCATLSCGLYLSLVCPWLLFLKDCSGRKINVRKDSRSIFSVAYMVMSSLCRHCSCFVPHLRSQALPPDLTPANVSRSDHLWIIRLFEV
ncbi:hypothetical protein SERLA73DRAFT_174614 [Serpula lacrymans var. lacrymans S7.3]|uniref:Uncharacterized protein n=1 Tax=Serpula lacrymans var. lacrymans (strain S7.3) TaxID=936435 RepID=F8PJ04_SERL3|nr:hypothetical protein SERLA73DRAFT_174614 [Serpula lacrymans var. lacrymans S7.3]